MGLAVVRSMDAPRSLAFTQKQEDFEQDLIDQFLLAAVDAGMSDAMVDKNWSLIFKFARFLGRLLWTAQPHDAEAFLARQHTTLGRADLTVQDKAWSLARFYDFLLLYYESDVRRLTGHVIIQVIGRFYQEIEATGGAIHALRDLFGMSIANATRWATTIDHIAMTAVVVSSNPAGTPNGC